MHLTNKEVAARLRISPFTLAAWRIKGNGPRFIKLGRKILYPLAEVEAFEKAHTMSSTAQGVA